MSTTRPGGSHFHAATVKSCVELLGAMGLEPGQLLHLEDVPPDLRHDWQVADPGRRIRQARSG